MKIKILASDSMGVRSMCTYVETKDFSILIDPSCALGPLRNNLYPHLLEIENLSKKWEIIKEYIKKSKILIFTHYHYDHHNPREIYLYKDKKIFLKNYKELNKRQKLRGEKFSFFLKENGINFEEGDSKFYKEGDTIILFSKPLPHGKSKRQGNVIGIGIKENNDAFFYTSDIQGFINEDLKEILYKLSPYFIFMDGPAFYIYSKEEKNRACLEFVQKIEEIKREIAEFKILILDHHSMRGKEWSEIYSFIKERLKKIQVEFLCAAEYECQDVMDYEAKRREIYEKYSSIGKKTS
jgi:predicted metallo-beta-lactamase superfamily hydrolase